MAKKRVRLSKEAKQRATSRRRSRPIIEKDGFKMREKRVLTLQLIDKICKLVETGLPMDAVLDYYSINYKSYWQWADFGKQYLEAEEEDRDEEHAIFGYFVQRLRKATAKYRSRLVNRLHTSWNDQWRRELAILERRDRKNFGRVVERAREEEVESEMYDPDDSFL